MDKISFNRQGLQSNVHKSTGQWREGLGRTGGRGWIGLEGGAGQGWREGGRGTAEEYRERDREVGRGRQKDK